MTNISHTKPSPCELAFARRDQHTLLVRMSGNWTLQNKCPSAEVVVKEMVSSPRVERIAFDAAAVTDWDSGFLIFLTGVIEVCSKDGVKVDPGGLPQGAQKLLALATAVPQKQGAQEGASSGSFLSRIGEEVVDFLQSSREILASLLTGLQREKHAFVAAIFCRSFRSAVSRRFPLSPSSACWWA